ncbi:MAG TPA: diaminopimelate decarboxylase [Clostridia bacterium]|jgi:diaminopimelate decarboxylase|nr:diaminopimelate decarboxylase [Clostridia bacterium]HOS18152.1 diaminopimelate decarboxylase [Clostridia bacterium]HPK14571.1 diaminopimelate decarboxylase [Clostridia bacterium]
MTHKALPFDKQKIEEIAKLYPTPFHLYDEAELRRRARNLRAAFAWNPGFHEHYAVKACPNPVIVQILHEEGCGTDCASWAELMLSEALGITGEELMFSSNDTPPEEFAYARRLGAVINLDDISHIDCLAANGGIPELISCRFNPGGEFRIGTQIMGNPADAKFGFTRAQLTEGFKKLKAMGAGRFGLHAFLSSCNTDNMYYPTLAKLLFTTARELFEELGTEIAFINLSGGIGIPYRPEDSATDIAFVGAKVREVYAEVFGNTPMRPAIYTELGRYMTGPAGYLVTRAIHHKDTYKRFIGVDACAANLMRPAIYGAYHHITVLGKENAPHDHVYDVTGSLCESSDRFAVDRLLPEIERGDLLVIHDTGAHGFSMGYNYNGKLRSAEVLLREDGSTRLIRRAETNRDYFATLDILGLPRLSEEK